MDYDTLVKITADVIGAVLMLVKWFVIGWAFTYGVRFAGGF